MNLPPYPNLLENAGLSADAVAGVNGGDGNTNVNVNSAVDVKPRDHLDESQQYLKQKNPSCSSFEVVHGRAYLHFLTGHQTVGLDVVIFPCVLPWTFRGRGKCCGRR